MIYKQIALEAFFVTFHKTLRFSFDVFVFIFRRQTYYLKTKQSLVGVGGVGLL
jgi:hypothetical protein